ncbi:hypothetical protein TIFTF001_054931 [Ficus carica]|uniref:Uncharacterized protein n=1 Tax=Ficus carica TaxID=3494 RepID=A0AA88JGZ8_FICCA|nr:hypothetical protein TIFTF001_054931 [Ficus carica]
MRGQENKGAYWAGGSTTNSLLVEHSALSTLPQLLTLCSPSKFFKPVQIAHQPSVHVLDTPAGVLVPILNSRGTTLHWRHWNNGTAEGIRYDAVEKVEHSLKDLRPKRRKPPNTSNLLLNFDGNVEEESDLEGLIEQQFEALQKALKIPHKASEARLMVSKKFLTLFRTG